MLVLFGTIAVGYLAGKLRIVGPDFNRSLSGLIINFCASALIINSVIGTERVLSNAQVLALTGIAVLSYAVLILIAQFLPRLLGVKKADWGVWRFMTIFSNVGFMGFPVVQAIYGAEAVFFAAIFQIPFNLLCFTYGARLIGGDKLGPIRAKQFLNPMVIATTLAYVLYLVGWRAPKVLVDFTGFVGSITSPGAMIVLGVSLASVSLKSLFTDWRVYVLSALKLVVIPVATFFALKGFVTNELMLGITVIIMAMPAATNATILAARYDGDQVTAAKGVFVSTLLSVGTIPLLMWLLF